MSRNSPGKGVRLAILFLSACLPPRIGAIVRDVGKWDRGLGAERIHDHVIVTSAPASMGPSWTAVASAATGERPQIGILPSPDDPEAGAQPAPSIG
jgi:hypothetical protein